MTELAQRKMIQCCHTCRSVGDCKAPLGISMLREGSLMQKIDTHRAHREQVGSALSHLLFWLLHLVQAFLEIASCCWGPISSLCRLKIEGVLYKFASRKCRACLRNWRDLCAGGICRCGRTCGIFKRGMDVRDQWRASKLYCLA